MPLVGAAKRRYYKRYYKRNKKEILAKTNAYLAAHPEVKERAQKNRIYKEHDITREEYAKKLKRQNGRCGICRCKDTRALSVDHNHSHCSGEQSCRLCNRGLLCNKCNKKLAVIEDKKFVRKAFAYLRKYDRRP